MLPSGRAGRTGRGGFAGLSGALMVLLASLRPKGAAAAAPSTDVDCALLVPLEEVRRGKGAFLSGCETLSEESRLGGCWTQATEDDTRGCQTCYIAEEEFSTALFPAMFSEELDPCPSSVDYTALYDLENEGLALVTLAELTSSGCPDGWLYSSDTKHCYFKSLNTAKAANQEDAAAKCSEEGAWVIAVESEKENAFLVNNMLWIGFFGETYTGMIKEAGSDDWAWPADASSVGGGGGEYSCLEDFSDWILGVTEGCASTYNNGAEGASCMEIYPYEPKQWNPFSCIVGKHYVCEMPGTSTGSPSSTSPSTSSTSTSSVGDASTPASTPAPAIPNAIPTRNPTAAPTTAAPISAAPVTAAPTTAEPTTVAPTTAAPTTAEPTTAAPTTAEPTTARPVTAAPTTAAPTTAAPTTAKPTTAEPTTAGPVTAAPSSAAPTTAGPITAAPTTAAPTTAAPTTASPTTASPSVTPSPAVISSAPTFAPTEADVAPTASSTIENETPAPLGEATGAAETGPPSSTAGSDGSGDDGNGSDDWSREVDTPAPAVEATTAAPSLPLTWKGEHRFTVTKRGLWGSATYSLHLREGETETAVVEGVGKSGLGTENDDYVVQAGCYRFQVTGGGDPSVLSWGLTGGDPARDQDSTSGEGLDGALVTVGGGVCDFGSCQAQCLAEYFTSEGEGGVAMSNSACTGYVALIAGACSESCAGDAFEDSAVFAESCVTTSCDAETVCGVEGGKEALEVDYALEVKALLSGGRGVGTYSTGGEDSEQEFETAVAYWLGVSSDDVSVTGVNGVDTEREGTSSSSQSSWRRRRRVMSSRDFMGRALQSTGSSSSPSAEYTRYVCIVGPSNATLAEISALEDTAEETNSSVVLQAWLVENGGSWSDVSVLDVEAEVDQFTRIKEADVDVANGDSEDGGNGPWYEDDPLATGGIAVGSVILLGIVIIACVVCRNGGAKTRSTSPTGGSGLTGDFEGGDAYIPSESQARQMVMTGTYNKKVLPSKSSTLSQGDNTFGHLAPATSVALDPAATVGAPLEYGVNRNPAAAAAAATTNTPSSPPSSEPRVIDGVVVAAVVKSNGSSTGSALSSPSRLSNTHGRHQPALGASHPRSFADSGDGKARGGSSTPGLGSSDEETAMVSGPGLGSGAGSQFSDAESAMAPAAELTYLKVRENSVGSDGLAGIGGYQGSNKNGSTNSFQPRIAKPNLRSLSSKVTSASTPAESTTSASATKRPNVRGPSGALATLGLGIGRSMSFDNEADDLYTSERLNGSSTEGDSEAGSRFWGDGGGSGFGSLHGHEGYGRAGSRRENIAEARILALKLSDRANVEVTRAPQDIVLPSPTPFSPGTDWALAQDLAPTPSEGSCTGQHRSWLESPGARRQNKPTPTRTRRQDSDGRGDEIRRARPPVSRSGSFHRPLGNSAVSPGAATAYDSDAASRAPSRASAVGGRRSTPRARRRSTGRGRMGSGGIADVGGNDSDCESRLPEFPGGAAGATGVKGGTLPLQKSPASVMATTQQPQVAEGLPAGGPATVTVVPGGSSAGARTHGSGVGELRAASAFFAEGDSDGESHFHDSFAAATFVDHDGTENQGRSDGSTSSSRKRGV